MGVISDLGSKFLDRRLPGAMRSLGIVTTARVAQSIDHNCPQYYQGMGGHAPPGAPPYKETGNLLAGLEHDDTADSTTISSSRAPTNENDDPNVPIILEFFGHPYMRPVMNQAQQIVPEVMERAFDVGATPHVGAG